ncbi:N-acetyltransferase [Leptotrichia sp. OH3620_COT-345]|uniref:GNAT family N-acetyltransferase n=1 Tax=Leptotrichia sp. OH3620_COT-345 TaxID=2491048 RepID=UPI000F64E438|nr:GNAT family protein [Leptotrichia sp. OH3620_COT-345]RRD40750.1 N-acetyltransferase [Leptotrichia sp. OH3620_COT-345]
MKKSLKKEFNDIILKSLEKKDIEILRNLRNKEENRKCFIYQKEISKEEQENWYEKYIKKEDDVMFTAYLKESDRVPIGFAALYNIDKEKKCCEFGRIVIDKSKTGKKGLGYQITACLCNIGFENMDVEKIYLEVFSDNIPALKTYLKVGFEEKKRYIKDNKEIIYMEYIM